MAGPRKIGPGPAPPFAEPPHGPGVDSPHVARGSSCRSSSIPRALGARIDLPPGDLPLTWGGLRKILEFLDVPGANRVVVTGTRDQLAVVRHVLEEADATVADAHPTFRARIAEAARKERLAWQLATAFASVAFVGQTLILRRVQRRR